MCISRQVCHFYTKCQHGITMPDEEITCDSPRCKVSPAHPRNCSLPACRKTCWQHRQYPQQYTVTKNEFCPDCVRQGKGVNGRKV
ncbi:hypothetical protein BDZ89DRAFT_1124790 [Hymenopellis radicata]|nr:hypothetical protein BDZ89DRAFT_1124790 [Hymenopellis radicata]